MNRARHPIGQNPPVTGRRELSKAMRRDAILDAAMTLLSTRHSVDVTTEEIADLAGVSPATIYNLIGTRDDVVYALVDRVLDTLTASLQALDPADPIAAALLVIDDTVAAFVAHSAVFRQVVALAQRSAATRTDRPNPSEFQVAAMRRAQTMGLIRHDVDASGLGRQIFVSYTGAMSLWSAGRLDDEGFSVAARHGLFTALAAVATDEHRDAFVDQARSLGILLEQMWNRIRR